MRFLVIFTIYIHIYSVHIYVNIYVLYCVYICIFMYILKKSFSQFIVGVYALQINFWVAYFLNFCIINFIKMFICMVRTLFLHLNYRGMHLCCLLILYGFTFYLQILDPFGIYSILVYVYCSFFPFSLVKNQKADLKTKKSIIIVPKEIICYNMSIKIFFVCVCACILCAYLTLFHFFHFYHFPVETKHFKE